MHARRSLGPHGPAVCPIGLGGMSLSVGDLPSLEDAIGVIHAALDAGVDLLDTADAYARDHLDVGHNERLIAEALRRRPGSKIVVATKGGMTRPDGRWRTDGRPESLRKACEASLKALGVEAIALYQLHRPGPVVPFEESVGALAELRAEGKILAVGLSNVTLAQLDAARAIVPIASVQNRASVYDRSAWSGGVLAACERFGIAFLAYSPLGGPRFKRHLAVDPALVAVAARHDATPHQVALAWLLARSPVLIPIPGARRAESVVENAEALRLTLSTEDLATLDRAFPSEGVPAGDDRAWGDAPKAACRIARGFVAADPEGLAPLLRHLAANEPVRERLDFPVGTLLPDGRLDLCKQDLGPEGARRVTTALRGNEHVLHLLLGANGIGDDGAKAVAGLARESRSLQTLYLGCNLIGAEGAGALAEAVAENPNLRAVWIKRNPIGDAGARAFAATLRRPNGLRVLDLVNTQLGPEGLRAIAEALAVGVATVSRLYLGANRVAADDVPRLADLLRSAASLEHLYLGVNRLGDAGVRLLADALASNRTLRTLCLASNAVGPEGAWALAGALQGHPRLETLELGHDPSTGVLGEQGNRLGDEGAAALAEALPHAPALAALDLSRNGITDDGARLLVEALAAHGRLQSLDLGRGIAEDLRRDLRDLLRRNREAASEVAADPDVVAIRSVYRTAAPA